jgi:hypothetical protein
MQAFVGVLALIWLLMNPWAGILVLGIFLVGLLLWGFTFMADGVAMMRGASIPMRVEPHFEADHSQEQQRQQGALRRRVERLERHLKDDRSEVGVLRSRNEQLERDLLAARSTRAQGPDDPLYRRVGLHQDAPDWVLVAVQKAHRRHHHPDGYASQHKAEAEQRFKEAEQVFDTIWRQRRRRS